MNKLNELEKMCEALQVEKSELISELNDSRSECITATSKMAEEVGETSKEVETLNDENGLLPKVSQWKKHQKVNLVYNKMSRHLWT